MNNNKNQNYIVIKTILHGFKREIDAGQRQKMVKK
jgi:hypothetical protein